MAARWLVVLLTALSGCSEAGVFRFDLLSFCVAWSDRSATAEIAHGIARVCER